MPVNSFDNYYMSWIPEKPADSTPMYKSFARQLEYAILSFKLPPNTLLPPQRELADFLDVNLSTVTKAYKICEQKKLLFWHLLPHFRKLNHFFSLFPPKI